MIGAIIGDTVGSIYEFDNHRSKKFELFSEDCFLTDDSIMTLAVMEIMKRRIYNDKDAIIDTLKTWGRAYPHRGYGGVFGYWLDSDSRDAYNSYGNGAAMRISPVGYYANSEDEVKEAARAITEVTHNHPEGLKGAEVTAMCIYYAKIGKNKEFIKDYASRYYNLDFDYDELKRTYKFNETCQDTVPQAIYAFLISTDFEDAIRTAVSIGGDSDTLACITGGIAEAYYKHIPSKIIDELLKFVPEGIDKCNPSKIINEYLNDRLIIFTLSEEILENTFILVLRNKTSQSTEISFKFSKSKDLLIDYILSNLYCPFNSRRKINECRKESLEELNNAISEVGRESHKFIEYYLYENPYQAINELGGSICEEGNNFYSSIFLNNYTIVN